MLFSYQFGVTHLLSKTDDMGASPSNMLNVDDEYTRSALDQRQRLVVNWVSRLPFGVSFAGIVATGAGRP